MTNIEQEFMKVFGIEPKIKDGCKYADNYWNNEKLANKYGTFDAYLKEKCPYNNKECWSICPYAYDEEIYPKITDRVLLELLCIYNDMQGCLELCLTPCKYEDTKEMILNTLIGEKLSMKYCEEGTYMDVMTKRIKSLFREEGE